jgi:hypothetical protein
MKRIGPRMQEAVAIVAANPGCNKLFVAKRVGPNGSTKYGYDTVNRALAHGLITCADVPGIYSLTITPEGEAYLAMTHS